MASLPQAKAFGARTILRWVGRYPALALIAVIIVAIVVAQLVANAQRAAYEHSPAGKAEAAKQAQADKDEVDVSVAQMLVKARLRDPESASFLGVQKVTRNGIAGVCGFVNSRNGFGGMAGNEAFAMIDSDVIMANEASRKDWKRLANLCFGQS